MSLVMNEYYNELAMSLTLPKRFYRFPPVGNIIFCSRLGKESSHSFTIILIFLTLSRKHVTLVFIGIECIERIEWIRNLILNLTLNLIISSVSDVKS